MLGFLGLSYHAENIPPFKNQNFEKKNHFYFFWKFSKKNQKILKISVSNFCFPIYIGLYICLSAFEKKDQIQNWIKFTFVKSQLKFWDFSITSHCPNAKAPKFQLRFCGGKFYPILDLIFFSQRQRDIYRALCKLEKKNLKLKF